MPTENLLTYTEEDPGSTITITQNKISLANTNTNTETRVWKDFGSGFFNGVNIDFEFRISSDTDEGVHCGLAVTNTPQDLGEFGLNDFMISLNREPNIEGCRIVLIRGNWVAYDAGDFDLSPDTRYYATVIRAPGSSIVSCFVYSDAARADLVSLVSLSGFTTTATWRYLMPFTVMRQANNLRFTGFIQNIDPHLGLEDLSTYTEIDPDERIYIMNQFPFPFADRIHAFSSLWCHPGGTKVYKDFGAGYFDALNIYFEIFLHPTTGEGTRNFLLCLSNSVTEVANFDSNDIMVSIDRRTDGSVKINLLRGGDFEEWEEWEAQENTPYYLTLSRLPQSNNVDLNIYSDAGRTSHLATLTLTGLDPQTKWRYLYGYNVYDLSTVYVAFTGYIQSIYISAELPVKKAAKITTRAPRVVVPKVTLLSGSETPIADISKWCKDVSVAFDIDQTIKRTAKLVFWENDELEINWLTNRFKIEISIKKDGKTKETPLGIFLASLPKKKLTPHGIEREVELFDKTLILIDDKFPSVYTVAAGTNYMTAIQQIAQDAGVAEFNLPTITSVLPAAISWDTGTERIKAINDLLEAINYYSAYFDRYGRLCAKERGDLSLEEATFSYQTDSASVIAPEIDQEFDQTRLANKIIVRCEDTDRAPFAASYTNSNPDSPISTVNLGRTIVKVITSQNIVDASAAYAYAQAEAQRSAMIYEKINFKTIIIPEHEAYDIVELVAGDISAKYLEGGWSMNIKSGELMSHDLRRIVPV